jgi:hypothetical protein
MHLFSRGDKEHPPISPTDLTASIQPVGSPLALAPFVEKMVETDIHPGQRKGNHMKRLSGNRRDMDRSSVSSGLTGCFYRHSDFAQKALLALISGFALFALKPALAAEPKLAVLDFKNDAELSPFEIRTITAEVRSVALLLPAERYDVVDNERIRQLIGPKKYEECAHAECLMEVGRLAQSEYFVVGEVGRFGEQQWLQVNMTLYSLDNNELLSTERASASEIGEIMKSLQTAAAKMLLVLPGASDELRDLAASGTGDEDEADMGVVHVSPYRPPTHEELGASIQNPLVDEKGFLFVDSQPRGAKVLINGDEKGTTPYEDEVMVGDYVVFCTLGALYQPARKSIRLGQEGARLMMELKDHWGVLKVESEPSGAAIALKGEPTGEVTPHTFPKKRAGMYGVTLSKDLYLSKTVRAELGKGETTPIELELEPNFGSIEVRSTPSGGAIWLDGVDTRKRTRATLKQIVAGLHHVEVRSAKFHSKKQRVSVAPRETAHVDVELEGKIGMLIVTAAVVDQGAAEPVQAEVWIDGERAETRTPFKKTVLMGSYEVEVRAADAQSYKERVTVSEGEKERVKARMTRLLPEDIWRQRAVEVRERRVPYYWGGGLLIAGGVVSAAIGTGFLTLGVSAQMDERDAALKEWKLATDLSAVSALEADVRAADDQAKTYDMMGWIGLASGAAMVVGGVTTLLLRPSLPQRSVALKPGRPGRSIRDWTLNVAPMACGEGGGILIGGRW